MAEESESVESMDIDDADGNSNPIDDPNKLQSPNKLLHYVPYSTKLLAQVEKNYDRLKENLSKAIISKNVQLGVAVYTQSLQTYIHMYGMRFTKKEHVNHIKLYYELLTMEECPLNLTVSFCQTYCSLLRKPHLLTREDITIPWRPLFETLDRCVYHRKYTVSSIISKSLESHIKTAIVSSNKYFDGNTLQEVIETFKPLICPSTSKMIHCLDMLKLFLPYFNPDTIPEFNKFLEFLLEIHNTWNNNPTWEWMMMAVLGCSSWYTVGKFDWEPHLSVMYSRLMKGLCLPVYFKGIQNNPVEQSSKSFCAASAARWIVGTLGNQPSAIRNLKNFLETVETFYNPLNMGRWSLPLATLLNEMVTLFTARLKRERYSTKGRYWWISTPEDRKLTDEDIDEFVQMTSELVLDFYLDIATSGYILKNLACIRPAKIIPAVMEKYESLLDSVTEPKKYLITMRWMTIILLPMVTSRKDEEGYDGRSMVIPFALSLLPTITCNDMQKTLSALAVIHGLFNLIPFVDCSSLGDSLEDEYERNLCLETGMLEDFSLQFLDAILALVESKTHENTRMADNRATNTAVNIEDANLEKVLWAVSHRLACQSSTKICKSAAKKIVRFAFSRILETDVSGRLFGSILQAFAAARPDIVLPKLLPKLCASIESLITDDMLDDADLDKFLFFHMLLLSQVTQTTGTEILKYKTELESVIICLLKLNGKNSYTFVSNSIQRLLNALCFFYPLENRISEADFDNPEYLAINDWGLTMDKRDIHINWHVPNLEELEWAKSLFLKVFTQFSSKYDGIANLTKADESINKRLLKDLNILTACLDGIQPLLPFWDNEPLPAFAEAGLDFRPYEYDFDLPNVEVIVPGTGQNIKQKYFEMLCGILTYLNKYRDDDTEVYAQLIKLLDKLIFFNMDPERLMSIPAAPHKNLKNSLQNLLKPKWKCARANFVGRAFDFHVKRLQLSVTRTWTASHMLIMEKMYELSCNRYARVRMYAQSRFCRMVDTVTSIINRVVTPLYIEKLRSGIPHDEYKGTLYTMLTCKHSPLLHNSWSQIRNLWVALLQSPFSEKNSIIKCMETVRKLLSQSFMYFPMEDKISAKAVEIAKELVNDDQIQSWDLASYKPSTMDNKQAFDDLISDLLNSVDKGMNHWRQRVLCCNMLSVLIVENFPMPRKMVEYFYDCLISNSIDVRTTALHTISWFTVMFKRQLEFVEVNTKLGLKYAQGESMHTVFQYKANPSEEGIKCGKLEVRDINGQVLPTFYIHKMHYAYAALPLTLKVKLPPKDYSDFSNQPECIRVPLEVANKYFNNPEYVKRLMEIFSEEEKGGKSCGNKRTRLFIALTRNNGTESLRLIMKSIAPLAKDKDQWKQRCAADVLSGIVYGLKLWDNKEIEKFWIELRPVLNEYLDSVTQETLGYWSDSMTIPTTNRDPNMMRFYIELMKERWATSLQTVETTSVNAYKNMNFFDNTVASLHWRGTELYHEIFTTVQKYFIETPIPYVNVRDAMGRLIGDIFEWTGDQPVLFEQPVSPKFEPFVDTLFKTLEDLVPEAAKFMANDSENNEVARKLILKFKSVLELVISLCWDSETTVDPVIYRFIPLCCHFESYDADPELKSLSGVTLSGFSRLLTLPKHINLVLDQIEIASSSTSWKSRLCVVEFLKVFALNNTNVFASSQEFSDRIMKLVLARLSDRKIEVREAASKLLSGFLHSLIVQKPMELLELFQKQARAFSRKLQVAWKKTPRESLTTEEIDTGHSAILGLCAFVETYPYEVPQFLPNVLVTLSTHLHDPQPIPTTLRKCLSNFRRTHHDNWAIHKTKFSEDQLCILTDIFVSPCYYA